MRTRGRELLSLTAREECPAPTPFLASGFELQFALDVERSARADVHYARVHHHGADDVEPGHELREHLRSTSRTHLRHGQPGLDGVIARDENERKREPF